LWPFFESKMSNIINSIDVKPIITVNARMFFIECCIKDKKTNWHGKSRKTSQVDMTLIIT
jgi:hypothetical protein